MKKQVKSLADLKRTALARGATVDLNGGRFNTTEEKLQPARAPTTPPAPPPAPPLPTAPSAEPRDAIAIHLDMEPVAKAMEVSHDRMGQVVGEALRRLPKETPTQPPKAWVFTIHRDTRGYIESVEANPVS